jgi:alpha-2-macroglobulin
VLKEFESRESLPTWQLLCDFGTKQEDTMQRVGLAVIFWAVTALGVWAQNAVPDFRYFATRDMDFYGADLDPLFDTDYKSCVRACSSNSACEAFTFNTQSNACFPKQGVSDQTPYVGAFSAVKIPASSDLLNTAGARAADLSFLSQDDLKQASEAARTLGLRHPAGGYALDAVIKNANSSAVGGYTVHAADWIGTAVSLTDRSDLWTDYARRLMLIRTQNNNDKRHYENRAVSAAINGYLRGENVGAQASALLQLADALERVGRGQDTIPALRLAYSLQQREDIENALSKAVGKYGLRIIDTTVEADTAAPRICVEFSERLSKAGVDYEPFVQLPDAGLAVQVDGHQLCIDGAEHGTRYRFTLREGLPAAGGEKLHKDIELTQYVRDRSPSVKFPGRSYVLPKSTDAALPVETVNVSTIELRLRKVSDRNLLRAVQDGYFGRPLSHWEDEEFASDIADEIWVGSAEVASELNRDMTTRLSMAEAIAGQSPGIYALSAEVPGADPYENPGATQWFVLSDLGISTMAGTDGLHTQVRGLSDAMPRGDVKLTLLSRANAVLGQAMTDDTGYAVFEPGLTRGTGAAAPAMVLAEMDNDDIGFLSLTDPAFDLSDRGVEGRAPAGPVDVFLTTDRGAYRAGEIIHVTALTRDDKVAAIEGLPLIAILSRPDGVEYSRHISDGGKAGGHVFALPVGSSAPRGTWRLDIKSDPDAQALASQTVLVEDFLPERIDFDLALPDAPLRPGDTPPLSIDARYLFGAPGSDLSIDGQVILRSASSVAAWPGYQFGRYDMRTSAQSSYFGGERTDADGFATVALDLPDTDAVGQPLEAIVIARLADGSARPVERRLTAPVRPGTPVIGIKPMFDDVVAEGSEAGFQIIGLTPDLEPLAMQVRWTLNRVETRYQWYKQYGNWNWEPITRRTRVATDIAELGKVPLALSEAVGWGEYELVVERTDGTYAAASLDFYAGWYGAADASTTPDRLEMSLDKASYVSGDTAILRIVPRAAGTAMVSVMSNHLIERHAIDVEAGQTQIPLQVSDEWGIGAYVTATVIQPMDLAAGQNPVRSIGLSYAMVAPANKSLTVTIDTPEIAKPRETQRVRVSVEGAAQGEQVWLTLAAVDLGILNLTGFEGPDPKGYYFGQRRLGVEMRDVYGRLIDGMNGAMGVVRSGGDNSSGMRMQSPPPTQDLMAAFSGPVKVDGNGEAFVDIALPAFNGTVRLNAVVWSDVAVGQAEADMLVRDPVVVTASVPRFLAPGDSSRIRLEAVHADGPSGQMTLALVQQGTGLEIGAAPGAFSLSNGGKAVFEIPVIAQDVGDSSFDLVLTTPDGRELRQTLVLPVRSNDPVVAQTRRFSLRRGDTFKFSEAVFADLRAGTGRAIVSAGPLAKFDAPGLLTMLDRYPYGCTEQVTSGAMPLLYMSAVAQASGLGNGPEVQDRVDAAIKRVLTRQASNGAFGLWRAESGDFWLDAYVTDFLSRARAVGYVVPDQAFRLAMDNLRNRVNYAPDFDEGGEDIAYALMVLAREGAAAMGDLRYYVDVKAGSFDQPLAAAQLGAALAAYGDQTRADVMFAQASRLISSTMQSLPYWRADYGTRLRDVAAVLALATEAGSQAIDTDSLTARLTRSTNRRLSTQEASWSLLAAHALINLPEQSGILVNGAAVNGPFVQVLEGDVGGATMDISSANGQTTDITLTTFGVPQVAPKAGGTGYNITRSYFTMEGDELDPSGLSVGDRFVTMLRVSPYETTGARLMINDPLPAGVEIDNPSLLRSGDVRALDWLKLSDADHTEFRSDRFLAAVDIGSGAGVVTLGYVARAVTPGIYHHPAASVEDMYRPRNHARTDTGQVMIAE